MAFDYYLKMQVKPGENQNFCSTQSSNFKSDLAEMVLHLLTKL